MHTRGRCWEGVRECLKHGNPGMGPLSSFQEDCSKETPSLLFGSKHSSPSGAGLGDWRVRVPAALGEGHSGTAHSCLSTSGRTLAFPALFLHLLASLSLPLCALIHRVISLRLSKPLLSNIARVSYWTCWVTFLICRLGIVTLLGRGIVVGSQWEEGVSAWHRVWNVLKSVALAATVISSARFFPCVQIRIPTSESWLLVLQFSGEGLWLGQNVSLGSSCLLLAQAAWEWGLGVRETCSLGLPLRPTVGLCWGLH